jgi:hypothetical protein
LLNDGKSNFSILSQNVSGIVLQGQVRDMVIVKQKDGQSVLFLQNNEYPVLYKFKSKVLEVKKMKSSK